MRTIVVLMLLVATPLAMAQAPAPAPDAAAKVAAEQAAARKTWEAKRAKFDLCMVQNEVVANYQANAKQAGKTVTQPVPTPPCDDPGAFEEAKPREAAGAHSPADTATSPPSQRETAAEVDKGVQDKPADAPTGVSAPTGDATATPAAPAKPQAEQ